MKKDLELARRIRGDRNLDFMANKNEFMPVRHISLPYTNVRKNRPNMASVS